MAGLGLPTAAGARRCQSEPPNAESLDSVLADAYSSRRTTRACQVRDARAAGSAAENAGHDPPDTFSQREPLTDQRERRLVLAAQLNPIEVRRQTDVTRQGSRQEREARRELPGRTRCATTGVLPGEGQPRRSGTTSRPPRWKDHHHHQQQQQQQPPPQQQQRLARVRQYV